MRSRHRRIFAAVTATALASMAIVVAVANATQPAPPYQDFAGCPNQQENPFIAGCLKLTFSSGHIGIGKRQINVVNPIILRGGYEQETGNFVFNSEGGIVPVKQPLGNGFSATVELAGQPGSVNEPTRTVPIKIHFEGPNLGSTCYIGSTTSPIALNLTTGTTSPPPPNMPITGKQASEPEPEATRPEVETGTGGIFVDNSYSVPTASGCVYTYKGKQYNVNGVANKYFGLPSAAGKNTTELNFSRSFASQSTVYPNG